MTIGGRLVNVGVAPRLPKEMEFAHSMKIEDG